MTEEIKPGIYVSPRFTPEDLPEGAEQYYPNGMVVYYGKGTFSVDMPIPGLVEPLDEPVRRT